MPLMNTLNPVAQAATGGLSDWLPATLIDTLYDYQAFLDEGSPIASFDKKPDSPPEVAVIGAGPAGIVAAYELLRAGIQPTILEASDRIGGRHWSRHFKDTDGKDLPVWAEMGAMRIPASNNVFWHYANQLGVKTGSFPDPGKVPTLVFYENTPYEWMPSSPGGSDAPPDMFAKIQADFGGYLQGLIGAILMPWYNGGNPPQRSQVVSTWQSYLDQYKDMTMYDAVRAGIPGWTTEEFNAFSALGVGSGGFGNLLFSVGMMELLRHLVNRWDMGQELIVGWRSNGKSLLEGMNGLTRLLYQQPVRDAGGQSVSLRSRRRAQFNSRVVRIEKEPGTRQVKVTWMEVKTGRRKSRSFDAVIVATTTRSMEIEMGLTLPAEQTVDLGSAQVRNAVRNFHLMSASKMFIRTKTKFWLDPDGQPLPGIPQSIQTDELPRQVYCLDYPHTKEGVVLISYTWDDDSNKLLGLAPVQRFRAFKEALMRICPEFAQRLVPVHGARGIYNIDWQAEQHFYGGVKVQLAGQELYLHDAYFQFLSACDPESDQGIYLAGDCVSWAGQWTEGALQTALNAACAAARHVGATVRENSPLTQDPNLYHYGQVASNP
ncbi:MAG TPA: NAD(P)/FAD-dependent oxidoreductase [Anaerolineales bacterium]|nr:NAD(P)/FAD-dependent oxidoreductase [Anaerolineales bacterium]